MPNLRDQFNAYGDGQGHKASNKNAYADLPNPKRAQEIVVEARRRLAEGGGKASQLPAMVQRVSQEFATRDKRGMSGDRTPSYEQPNNMDAYIDKVLGMSSLGGDGSSGGGGVGVSLPDSAPIPSGRDTSDLEEMPAEADDLVTQGESDGLSFGQMLAGLAGIGGVYAAGRYLYNRYGKGDKTPVGDAADTLRNPNASAVDDSIDAVDGKGRSVVPYEEGMSGSPDPQQAQVADGKTARLAPPQQRIAGPNAPVDPSGEQAALPAPTQRALPGPVDPVDASINATMDEGDIDAVFQQRVEGSVPQPSTQPRYSGGIGGTQGASGDDALDISENDAREMLIEKVKKLPPREAVRMLQESGIELDDNMLRAIAESSNTVRGLQDRAGEIAGGVAKTIGRQAVR